MKEQNRNDNWKKKLARFPQVWDRVQGAERGRPPQPPFMGPPQPPFMGPPPGYGPPPPPPPPPLMPGRRCCTRAVRFNPHERRG